MYLTLNRLWVDADGMLQVGVFLEGGGYAATQDIYVHPDDLVDFGKKLQSFPQSISDEAVLEIGSLEPNAYCWFKLRAHVFDGRGHSVLELSSSKNGDPHICAHAHFSVPIEAASLNALGKQIELWAKSNEQKLAFERSDD